MDRMEPLIIGLPMVLNTQDGGIWTCRYKMYKNRSIYYCGLHFFKLSESPKCSAISQQKLL